MTNERTINSEVLAILAALGEDYINKLPTSVLKYLLDTCDINNIPKLEPNKRIEDQNISEDARAFLAMLKLNCWCDTEEEKQELINILDSNEKNLNKKLKEKYNPDKLFETKDNKKQSLDYSKNDTSSNEILVKKEESIFRKIINKIVNFFKKWQGI